MYSVASFGDPSPRAFSGTFSEKIPVAMVGFFWITSCILIKFKEKPHGEKSPPSLWPGRLGQLHISPSVPHLKKAMAAEMPGTEEQALDGVRFDIGSPEVFVGFLEVVLFSKLIEVMNLVMISDDILSLTYSYCNCNV